MRAFPSLTYMSTQSCDPRPSPAGRRPVRSDAPCFFRPCSLRRCEATRDGSLQAQYPQRMRPFRGYPLRTNWAGVRHAQQAWHTRLTQNCPFRVPGVEYSVYNSPTYTPHIEVACFASLGVECATAPYTCLMQRSSVPRPGVEYSVRNSPRICASCRGCPFCARPGFWRGMRIPGRKRPRSGTDSGFPA